jgi:hypothetical protein
MKYNLQEGFQLNRNFVWQFSAEFLVQQKKNSWTPQNLLSWKLRISLKLKWKLFKYLLRLTLIKFY